MCVARLTDRRTTRDELELVHWRSGIILSSSLLVPTSASATELLTLMCVPVELAPIVVNRLYGFLIRIEQSSHNSFSLSLSLSDMIYG